MASGPSWLRRAIACGNAFHYRKQRPWWHNALNVGCLLGLLASVVATVGLGRLVRSWAYVLPAGAALGVSFFALIILVIHEASHGMFVIHADRRRALAWNRLFGWLVSVPFAINYARHWEEGHHAHHLRPLEPDDPQNEQNGFTGAPLAWMLVKMLLIPGYVMLWNPSRRYPTHRFRVPASVAFWLVTVGLAVYALGDARPVAMLVLGLGVVGALNQLKTSMEHGGPIALEENRNFRSRTSFFPLRWLLMPFNISLHFEHHLNYCVPWYLLPSYHRALRAVVPAPLWPEVWNTRVLAQLAGQIGGLPEAVRPLLQDEPGSIDADLVTAAEPSAS